VLEKEPENYIIEYFEDLKRQMDLRREELKLKLDNCSDEIIQSIERTKEVKVYLSKEVNRIKIEREKSKLKLTKLIDRFDNFYYDEKKFEKIKQSWVVLNKRLNRSLCEYKDSIIGGREYTFDFEEIHIKGLLDCFKEVEKGNLTF